MRSAPDWSVCGWIAWRGHWFTSGNRSVTATRVNSYIHSPFIAQTFKFSSVHHIFCHSFNVQSLCFLPITVFSVWSYSLNGYAPHLSVNFFAVESMIGCCWDELSSAFNSEAVSLLCLLLLIGKYLASAAVVTFGVSDLFLSTFLWVSYGLCNKYFTHV